MGAGVADLDVGGQFEAAPVGADGRLAGARGQGQGRGLGGAQGARETEEVSAIHIALTHGEVWLSVRPMAGGRPLLPAAGSS